MATFGKSTFGDATFGGDGLSSVVARPTYAQFFLDSRSSVVQLETLEITIYHPPADTTFRLVRNKMDGLSASLRFKVKSGRVINCSPTGTNVAPQWTNLEAYLSGWVPAP